MVDGSTLLLVTFIVPGARGVYVVQDDLSSLFSQGAKEENEVSAIIGLAADAYFSGGFRPVETVCNCRGERCVRAPFFAPGRRGRTQGSPPTKNRASTWSRRSATLQKPGR